MVYLEATAENVKEYLDNTLTYKNFLVFQRLLSIDNKEQYTTIMKALINSIIHFDELFKLKSFTESDVSKFIHDNITFLDFEKHIGMNGYNMVSFYNIVTENKMAELLIESNKNETKPDRPFKYNLNITLYSDYYKDPSLFAKLKDIYNRTNNATYKYTDIFPSNGTNALYNKMYAPVLNLDYKKLLVNYDKETALLQIYPLLGKYILTYSSPVFYKYFVYKYSILLDGDSLSKDIIEAWVDDLYDKVSSIDYITKPVQFMNNCSFLIDLATKANITSSKIDKLSSDYSFLIKLRDKQEEWINYFFNIIRTELNGNFPFLPSNEIDNKG